MNQLTGLGGNGQAIFEGNLDKLGTVIIGDASPTTTDENNHFRVMASVVAECLDQPLYYQCPRGIRMPMAQVVRDQICDPLRVCHSSDQS